MDRRWCEILYISNFFETKIRGMCQIKIGKKQRVKGIFILEFHIFIYLSYYSSWWPWHRQHDQNLFLSNLVKQQNIKCTVLLPIHLDIDNDYVKLENRIDQINYCAFLSFNQIVVSTYGLTALLNTNWKTI